MKIRIKICFTLGIVIILMTINCVVGNTDWSQWRGPDGTGISTETSWLSEFPEEGPKVLWEKSVGIGCASVSIKDGRVYTLGNKDDIETIYCLREKTGDEIWKYSYPCPLDPRNFEGGPAATPTVDGNLIYTFSREGHFHCLDATTGKVIWSKNAVKDWGGKKPSWGFAGSPTVYKNLLIVSADFVVALNRDTGEIVWKSEKVGASYSTPVIFKYESIDYAAVFCTIGLIVLDVSSGEELFRHPWKTSYDVNAATPIISGNEIFISSGYDKGCALIKVTDGKPSVVWVNKNMRNHFNSSVLWEGYLYGFDESDLRCLDFSTGEVKWSQRGLGKASLMIADGKMIILTERKGELVIAQASPESYQEISRAEVLPGRCWVVPVFSGGQVYCKNNDGDLVCIDLKAK